MNTTIRFLMALVFLCGLITLSGSAFAYPVHRHAYSSVQSSYDPENVVVGVGRVKVRNHRTSRPREWRAAVKQLAFVGHRQASAATRSKPDRPEAIVRQPTSSAPEPAKSGYAEEQPGLRRSATMSVLKESEPLVKNFEAVILSKPEIIAPAHKVERRSLVQEQNPAPVDLEKTEQSSQLAKPEQVGFVVSGQALVQPGAGLDSVGKVAADEQNSAATTAGTNKGLSEKARLLLSVVYFGSFLLFVLLSYWWLSSIRKDETLRPRR